MSIAQLGDGTVQSRPPPECHVSEAARRHRRAAVAGQLTWLIVASAASGLGRRPQAVRTVDGKVILPTCQIAAAGPGCDPGRACAGGTVPGRLTAHSSGLSDNC
jgi:hypothetical protein